MLRVIAFTLGVVMSGALAGPFEPADHTAEAHEGRVAAAGTEPPRLQVNYAPVSRLSQAARKAVFAELSACHSEVKKKADELYPEMKLQSRGYSPKEDVKRFHERSRFEDAGVAACGRKALEKYSIDVAELRWITGEGVCKQWPPLAGKPAC